LVKAYDQSVERRESSATAGWKISEREKFLSCLRSSGAQSLMDLGSGPGVHAEYFRNQGLDVTCVDLSPAMVERCRGKGFEAYVCDALDLAGLGMIFDAVFALNSLLHVPSDCLTMALSAIQASLVPGGLFYWGQYGGEAWEGIRDEDDYEPKRFFSFLDDRTILSSARQSFSVEAFARIKLEGADSYYFQSLILRTRDVS
jgi:SAM-dependent methyltransferase